MKINLNLKQKHKETQNPRSKKDNAPNLLQNVLEYDKTIKPKFPISKISFYVIITIQTLFLLLVFYNTRMAFLVGETRRDIDQAQKELDLRKEDEKEVKHIINKIEILKAHQMEDQKFKPKVELLLDSIPANVILLRSTIEPKKFSITIETDSAIEVSLLIDKYIKQGLGNEVVIRAATLDTLTQKFESVLEVLL